MDIAPDYRGKGIASKVLEKVCDDAKNEGYLYKYVANKLKKVWFKLVHKDLFYFKNDKDEIHKGMHNLSGVFLNEEPIKEINGKKFYSFSIQYPKKTRYYFVEKESEYKNIREKKYWIFWYLYDIYFFSTLIYLLKTD